MVEYYTLDPKYAIYDDILSDESKRNAILNNILGVLYPITKDTKQLDVFQNEILKTICEFVFSYMVLQISQTTVRKYLADIKKHATKIKKIFEKTKFKQYVYNRLPAIYKKHPDLPRWDNLLTQKDTITVIDELLSNLSSAKYRPTSDDIHKNTIHTEFIKSLMQIYKSATGKKPTSGSSSNNNSSAFTLFADNILSIINTYFPRLGNKSRISIGINDIVKRQLKTKHWQ